MEENEEMSDGEYKFGSSDITKWQVLPHWEEEFG